MCILRVRVAPLMGQGVALGVPGEGSIPIYCWTILKFTRYKHIWTLLKDFESYLKKVVIWSPRGHLADLGVLLSAAERR